MKRILQSEPLPHVVICDTSILWHEDKGPVASPDFEEFWSTQTQQFDLLLAIPEVVKGELLFQHYTSCHKLLMATDENLNKISAITVAQHASRITPEKIKSEIEGKFKKWIHDHKATILPVPIAKIDWTRLANDAIWRVLPFAPDAKNPDAEKGFRDALIMETVCGFVQSDTRKINFAFVCNDNTLRTATIGRLKTDSRFSAHESLKTFESYLSLTKEALKKEFIAKIMSRAFARFYTRGDETSLLIREKLLARFQAEFKEYFDDVTKSEAQSISSVGLRTGSQPWVPLPHVAWTTGTQSQEFIKIENENIYYWKNVVLYKRLYSRGSSLLTTEEKVLALPFHVTWSSMVKKDARFHDLKIVDIKLVGNSFSDPTPEEKKELGLKDNPA